jgi:uncharacterized protein YndB with AHSA1/START domain
MILMAPSALVLKPSPEIIAAQASLKRCGAEEQIHGKDSQVDKNLIAKVSIAIDAPGHKVWNALVDPEAIRQYMFGTQVVSSWKEGSPIVWKGEWQGRPYEDKGVILQLKPRRAIQYTHFSPLSGLCDKPENYHTVTIELSDQGTQTLVSLSQDNNPTEEARGHSEKNWGMMLTAMKKLLEE